MDFQRLERQGNYRQIYDGRIHFITASAYRPDIQKRLLVIMENFSHVETAIAQSQKMDAEGNRIGAWEVIEKMRRRFPDDQELIKIQNGLTLKVADFVQNFRMAQHLEEQSKFDSSLELYQEVKAQYPVSVLAEEGSIRIARQLHAK